MADYKTMYSTLFNAMTDAINLLQAAQQAAEEIYISGDDAPIHIIGTEKGDGTGESAE